MAVDYTKLFPEYCNLKLCPAYSTEPIVIISQCLLARISRESAAKYYNVRSSLYTLLYFMLVSAAVSPPSCEKTGWDNGKKNTVYRRGDSPRFKV